MALNVLKCHEIPDGAGGTALVWATNPGIACFEGIHIAPAVLSAAVLLCVTLSYPLYALLRLRRYARKTPFPQGRKPPVAALEAAREKSKKAATKATRTGTGDGLSDANARPESDANADDDKHADADVNVDANADTDNEATTGPGAERTSNANVPSHRVLPVEGSGLWQPSPSTLHMKAWHHFLANEEWPSLYWVRGLRLLVIAALSAAIAFLTTPPYSSHLPTLIAGTALTLAIIVPYVIAAARFNPYTPMFSWRRPVLIVTEAAACCVALLRCLAAAVEYEAATDAACSTGNCPTTDLETVVQIWSFVTFLAMASVFLVLFIAFFMSVARGARVEQRMKDIAANVNPSGTMAGKKTSQRLHALNGMWWLSPVLSTKDASMARAITKETTERLRPQPPSLAAPTKPSVAEESPSPAEGALPPGPVKGGEFRRPSFHGASSRVFTNPLRGHRIGRAEGGGTHGAAADLDEMGGLPPFTPTAAPGGVPVEGVPSSFVALENPMYTPGARDSVALRSAAQATSDAEILNALHRPGNWDVEYSFNPLARVPAMAAQQSAAVETFVPGGLARKLTSRRAARATNRAAAAPKHSKPAFSERLSELRQQLNQFTAANAAVEDMDEVAQMLQQEFGGSGVHPGARNGWVELYDPSSQSPYYYHCVSQEAQWERPKRWVANVIAMFNVKRTAGQG